MRVLGSALSEASIGVAAAVVSGVAGVLQGALGVTTTLRLWHDTAHCAHYRKHSEEYREELLAFLRSLPVCAQPSHFQGHRST